MAFGRWNNKDKNHPGVTVERKRSNMIPTLVTFLRDGIVEISDIDDFSEELKDTVKKISWIKRSLYEKFNRKYFE